MLLEKEISEQSPGLSEAKKALLEKRLRAAVEQPGKAPGIPRRSRREKAPLSYEQERLWFLDQLEPNSPLYSLPLALRLRGSLNRNALQKSLAAIIGAHEVLRTRVIAENGEPVQVMDEPGPVELPAVDLSRRLAAQLKYWRGQLAGAPALLELPTDKPRPLVQSFRGATQTRLMPQGLAGRIQAFSRTEGATPFMALLAAFKALLVRYTHQDDLV